MDIAEVILSDHHEQRRLFALLDEMHDCRPEELDAVWNRLRILLEVHAKAEEELFYPALLDLGRGAGGKDSAGDETTDAIHDHNEIRDAVAEVTGHASGTAQWWAAVAKTNEVNGDHMAEEEREGLADFRQHAPLDLRHRLGLAFSIFESAHASGIKARDVSPAEYVDKNQ
ncbi:hemerythrin domain-containing protein [Arthrobacter sp. efr-133-TYG-104]|uniref:hemerythrin domain-containing protein n=1 Tax=Arthrobacter sp. efr-133-TYG-104 TaxID=3040324 RepID=UPI00254B57A3|nr:hemerythrin domain-containing protein [Arthrobacter sp. efr-133-TYG-104]